jgi:hypothetical protein
MVFSNYDCLCKNSKFQYSLNFKNCTCISGYTYNPTVQDCLLTITMTLTKQGYTLQLSYSPALPISVNDTSLFNATNSGSVLTVSTNTSVYDAYLKFSWPSGYHIALRTS